MTVTTTVRSLDAALVQDALKSAPLGSRMKWLAEQMGIGEDVLLTKAAKHFGNLTQASNSNTQYVIASATGTHPDGFPNTGFCAWHDFISSSVGNIAYTNLPYLPDLGAGGCTTISSPTLLDGYFSTETHEYAESVTDLWPSKGWLDASGNENGDLCVQLDGRLTLPTGTFDVQGVWSNAASKCVTKG